MVPKGQGGLKDTSKGSNTKGFTKEDVSGLRGVDEKLLRPKGSDLNQLLEKLLNKSSDTLQPRQSNFPL